VLTDCPTVTPASALAGGALVGCAATLLLWLDGRIAGVRGIAAGLLVRKHDRAWRAFFLAGLLGGALLHRAAGGVMPAPAGYPLALVGLAGLLVGYGTAMSGGCTSGHGVCGIARLSPRSVVATVVFMLAGMATVLVLRHVLTVVR